MKQRSTTPVSIKPLATKSVLVAAAVMMAISVPMSLGQEATARDYDAEINAIQQQINELQSEAGKLRNKANSLKAELSRLASEKAQIQAEIDLSQAKREKLEDQIAETIAQIEQNALVSGEIINDMAISDDEPLFMQIATSENLADVIDTFENQLSVQKELKRSTDETKKLKKELEAKKAEVERVIADQENQRKALSDKEAERQRLLNETNGKEAQYQKLSSQKQAEKERLVKEQQAAIAAAYSGGRGGMISAGSLPGYTAWAGNCTVDNAGYSHGGAAGGGQDPAGYGCNQCVSYTAWKMGQKIGYIPSYWGNANMWPASARAAGFKTGSQARAGSLGVISAGQYGHIVYVESVNPDGTVNISQYNEWLNGEGGKYGFGHYSTRSNVNPATYDTYIYI